MEKNKQKRKQIPLYSGLIKYFPDALCEVARVSYKGSLDIGIYDCSEEFYESGKNKVTKALETYQAFFIDGADLDSYCIKGTLWKRQIE